MIGIELLERLVGEITGEETKISPDSLLSDSGLDSLDMMQLLQEVEKETGTPVNIGRIGVHMTFSELIALINKR